LERHWSERQWRGIVEARRPRLTQAAKGVVKDVGVPEDWKPARTRQADREGRWTLKRARKQPVPPGGAARTAAPEIGIPMFGYKNHFGIDREHGFVRRFKVTDAAAHDAQFRAVLEPANTASPVWADTAYRSAANFEKLERYGLKPQFQRARPRGASHVAHRARIHSRVEHVLAAQKCRFALVIRKVGKAHTTTKLALASLAYYFTRFLWPETRKAA
jgi:hypothetical protein